MFRNFFIGISAYSRALQLIKSMRLWSFFLVPALISVLLAGIIFSVAWYLGDDVGRWISDLYPWETGQQTIRRISVFFGSLLLASVGLILYKNLVMALASPFMSKLSERIEKRSGLYAVSSPYTSGRMLREIIRGLRIALRNISRELFFTLLLLLVGLIPFFSPFVVAGIFLIQSYYAGFGSMDYTLERHLNVKGSIRFVRDYRWLAIGNGSIFVLLLMTGIGFLVALPLSTAAATPEVLKRLTEDR
ncbi:MAG: EI24 domain-containing protein [Saprospiraceae bacterium]|nr:EI24 domain-containing protein [Lewinella sp.]